jgi:hypothetical protein
MAEWTYYFVKRSLEREIARYLKAQKRKTKTAKAQEDFALQYKRSYSIISL